MTVRSAQPTPGRPRPKGRPVSQLLVEHAARLFAERGYSATTVNDVVAAANLTKGAFYYHFKAKDDLLFEIYHVVISAELDSMLRVLQLSLPPLASLRALIADVCEVTARFQENVVVYTREMHLLSPEKSRALRESRRRYHNGFRELVARAKAEGSLSPEVDTELATIGFFGLLHQYYFWYRSSGRPFDDEEFVREATAWFFRSLGAASS